MGSQKCVDALELYGGMDEPEIKIVDVFICKLRKKLANASNGKDYIETIWGRGYLLREPHEDKVATYAKATALGGSFLGRGKGAR